MCWVLAIYAQRLRSLLDATRLPLYCEVGGRPAGLRDMLTVNLDVGRHVTRVPTCSTPRSCAWETTVKAAQCLWLHEALSKRTE